MSLLFYSTCSIAILATFMAMFVRKAVHGLVYLVLSFLALSVAIYDLGAPFAAALEVIIYAGAIMVLFLLVVMLLDPRHELNRRNLLGPSVTFLLLLGELIWAMPTLKPVQHQVINSYEVMTSLFINYGTLVELASFLLLAGVIAAYRIGKK